MIYAWNVTGMKVDAALGDAVIQTYWTCTGSDQGGSGTFNGATPFRQVAEGDDFVPFDQLTEDLVLGWIQQEIDKVEGYRAHIELKIEQAIVASADLVVEKKEVELPWVTPIEDADAPPAAP